MNALRPIIILTLVALTAACASDRTVRRIPGFSNTQEAREALGQYPEEKVLAVVNWFPVSVDGCPGWSTVDLEPVADEALIVWVEDWEHRLLDIKVRGCEAPLDAMEARLLVDTIKDVYFPDRPMRVEYIPDEDWIMAAWLAAQGYGIETPPDGMELFPQRLPLNRKIVDRFNRHVDRHAIDRVYVAMRITQWEFY